MVKKSDKANVPAKNAAKGTSKKAMDPEKAAKRKARMEALKNRPIEQRPNSKQIDVIKNADGVIEAATFGYPVKAKGTYMGVLTTTIAYNAEGTPVGVASAFVPGNLTIKVKKGHGGFVGPKHKGEAEAEEAEAED